jgi:environmental stress-induced protein Ves
MMDGLIQITSTTNMDKMVYSWRNRAGKTEEIIGRTSHV